METTENFEMTGADPGVVLTPEAQGYLRESGKWANFLGIVGFVLTGLIVIIALFAGTMMASLSTFSAGAGAAAGMGGLLTVIYLVIAVVYFFFSLYLYQFGSQVKKGLMYVDSETVTIALGKLKSFFKLWGILTIVVLSLYALMIIIVIIFGMSAGSMMGR